MRYSLELPRSVPPARSLTARTFSVDHYDNNVNINCYNWLLLAFGP
jgi:hypothetical protein